jgi:uncharacterized protein YndB with AHSA1/START domain
MVTDQGAGVRIRGALLNGRRLDMASRVILASPRTLFRTFLDAEALACWRTPETMTGRVMHLDPRVGGGYTMVLRYGDDAPTSTGKTRTREDEVEVRFLELSAEERIVEEVHFISTDPAFEEPMILTTILEPAREGTKVKLRAENVPSTISETDHHEGMLSALRNLARLTE